ncbi:MAG: acyl-CoA dehydrogenase [Chloroflexi bacterium AL-W]|nr:acyl-CoA dehydrogenase [Chloroflexi bacterium AL-N1]NOK67608.1 acyl-CoA dehydrogenase [Chloroflexi bacterium AL-N10]NOK75622.1 acyl-CoA dehydrogenase [Chloroflexi bacterium AL-N5]NOK82410.1 acyl-CoA dehydrogenase [Chloroflexi bacterium AL-W]NOK90255.1 acyl-CoA dehydrogenase [Chloroflexi bacterium AL-N15]
MEYTFSDELNMLRQAIREFAAKEVAPIAREIDEEERVPIETLKKAGELGLLGVPFPEEYGGIDAGIVGYCILMEEIQRKCASTATIIGAHTQLCAMSIYLSGNEDQKKRYLKSLNTGEKFGAWALTEPGAGSDAAHITTTAELRGDEWVLNGNKMWITNGSFADIIVVFAVNNRELGARGGISAFIVEKDFPGFHVGKVEDKMGLRASHTAALHFEDCRVPRENLIGEVGKGFSVAMQTLDIGRCGLGASSLGSAKEAYELALSYSIERQQFGRPIADFQAIQFKLADMIVKIYTMEQILYDCANKVDRGEPATLESSIVKLYATDAASDVIDEAIQIYGGMGFSREVPLERMYRDARVTRIFEGTNEIQRHVIASEILKRAGHKIKLY